MQEQAHKIDLNAIPGVNDSISKDWRCVIVGNAIFTSPAGGLP